MIRKAFATIILGCVSLTACGLDSGTELGSVPQEERYSDDDDPRIFTSSLEAQLAELPREGIASSRPWAGNYWPTFQDSINYRWAGTATLSPAAKYGLAYGRSGVEDAVSAAYGIDQQSGRPACTRDSQCNPSLAERCAKRVGATVGRCIPTWWGICHAWAPAAILHEEPRYPVTHNGVTFAVQDVKALLTLAYDRSTSRFASLRCNEDDSAGEIEYDGYDRPADSDRECRDTNPATLHILLANYLGLRGESFVYDRSFDYQVWNQPIRDFKVTQLREVTTEQAHSALGVRSTGGTVERASGVVTRGEWYHHPAVSVAAGDTVTIAMDGTGDADLYVRFGAQPTTSSYDCRPYYDGSAERCELTVPAGRTQMFVSVRGFAPASSEFDVTITYGDDVSGAYVFNDDAVRLYYVETTVGYISESPASRDGHLGDDPSYRREDRYQYILEEDAAGYLIGGEYVGASKRRHPDFVWLPTGRRSVAIAGGAISFADIQSLYQRSIESEDRIRVNESGTVTKSEWRHFGPYPTTSDLRATLSGNGDADLYVRVGARPTTSAYHCRPYLGSSAEQCQVSGPGNIYVSVNGWAARSDFELAIEYR